MSENRRRGARRAQPEQQAPQEEAAPQQHLPPPPPMTIEQMFLMQTQEVQAIGQTLAAMQQAQQQPPPPQPPVQVQMPQVPRDKRVEFMRGHPPVFAHSADPMDAEDWLRTVEHELHSAQCNDRKKVLYGPRQLRGASQSWWESYLATHANPEAITWEEFRENFHRYHVPEGLMIVRKEEFLALKQGPLSVSEYRDKFLQLSRYAPEDVNMDAKRQYCFLRGLIDPLHYQLMNHTFPTFQHLIDRAIMTERKRREMEDRKRKIGGPQVGSSSRPRYSGNSPHQFKQGHQHQHHRQNQQQQEAVSSAAATTVPSEHSAGRKSVPASEQPGSPSSCPSNQPEWPSSPNTSRRSCMLLLWRTKSLGEELSKESSPATTSSQCPSKTRSTTTSTRSLWSGLQPWKGESPGGRSNPGCSGCGSRYVSS
jgi:hypothetical protein